MPFRRDVIWTSTAIGFVLMIGALAPAAARAQGFGDYPVIYRPAKGAKDLRSVLFNWTWSIQVDGQPCTLTKYRVSTNYQTPGQRVQYTCTRPNGQTYSNIEVVSRQYAWNEDIPGAEIIPGRGKATPMPDAVQERLIGGFFHSDQMHVIEKLTRKGNKIRYEVTVDDQRRWWSRG